MDALQQHVAEVTAAQATGCPDAGGYIQFAKDRGYTHIEVINWSSSAGDWSFIVSKDGYEWYIMCQENNWPRPGFTRTIDEPGVFYGDAEAVLQEIYERWYA